jgi:hypothetical protein
VLAPITTRLLVGAIALLIVTAWITVLQRILHVRQQLRATPRRRTSSAPGGVVLSTAYEHGRARP